MTITGIHAVGLVAAVLLGATLAGSDVAGELADVLPELYDDAFRGAQLTRATVDADGVVLESAEELARQASEALGREVSIEAQALARVCRSEEGRAGQRAKTYLCHVMLNQAGGRDIVATIQAHNTTKRNGHFGAQISGAVASGADPFESDLNAAEYALAERAQGIDPTNGATNFVDRRAFGVQAGTGSFEDLLARWGAAGKVPGRLPDAPDNLIFFWAGSVPDGAEVLA